MLFFVLSTIGWPTTSLAASDGPYVFFGEEPKEYEYETPAFTVPIILASLLTACGYEIHHDSHSILASFRRGTRSETSDEVEKVLGTTLMIIGGSYIVYTILRNTFPKKLRVIFKKNSLTYQQKDALRKLLKDI